METTVETRGRCEVPGLLTEHFANLFCSRSILFVSDITGLAAPQAMRLLRNSKIAILADRRQAMMSNGQWMILSAVNILSRLFWNICVHVSGDPKVFVRDPLAPQDKLSRSTTSLAKKINPFGNFTFAETPPTDADAIIIIGGCEAEGDNMVSVNSDGWNAHVKLGSGLDFVSHNENPAGALLATSLGVAKMFDKLVAKEQPNGAYESFTLSAFDYQLNANSDNPMLVDKIDLGEMHLIGAGAIGSSLCYALSCCGDRVEGSIQAVDPERLEPSNLNRYMLATYNEAKDELLKVDSLRKIQSNRLKIIGKTMRFQEFIRGQASRIHMAVVGVDDIETRWRVQETFPHNILNGGSELGYVQISRHSDQDFLEKACLGCLNPIGSILPTEPVLPTISFVPAFIAAVILGEIIKQSNPQYWPNRLDIELTANLLKLKKTLAIRSTTKSNLCGIRCKDLEVIKNFLRTTCESKIRS